MKRYSHPDGHVFYRKMKHARPMISHGQGIYLYDRNGKQYLDGSGGPFVVNVGHGRAEVIDAIRRQIEAVAYAHAIMFTSEPLEEYAAALNNVVLIPDARFFFLSSGTEAVEGALKLARQIQQSRGEEQRHLIIGRHQSYHGLTLGALSVSGRPSTRSPFIDMFADMPRVSTPYPYRDSITGERLANQLENTILGYGPEKIAAFIAEPISGATLGAAFPPADYWPRVRQICDRYGILLISDEVLVGFGRTGRWWGLNHWQIVPDIMVTSKGAAGGYLPLSFLAARGSDIDGLQLNIGDFNHGGTFSHHAAGAAAGLAVLKIIQQEELVTNSARMGVLLGARLESTLGDHPNVGDIRGRGLFWGLEFVQDKQTKQPFPASMHLAWKIWQRAFENGLVVYYSQGCYDGLAGDIIMVGPPLIISESQVDELVELLAKTIREFRFY